MEIVKYPDGTSYVKLSPYESYKYTFRINTYEDLHHLEQLVEVCNSHGKTPEIIIPNLIDAQADRRFDYYHSSGLKIVCKRLNSLKANFKIFHPHNPEVVEALMDNVKIIDNSRFIMEVLTHDINFLSDFRNSGGILMSSDAGGFKPLMKLCDKIQWDGETYSATKSRKYNEDNMRSTLTQIIDRDDFEGKDILIIDDICVYGGTFKGLSKMLRERNCGKLYLAVSHMTVQNLGEDPVTNYFDKVFTTDSKFDYYVGGYYEHNRVKQSQPENLKVIKGTEINCIYTY